MRAETRSDGDQGAPDERGAMRREQILEAARGLFQKYGYKKTTMDEIAGAAGITKPTIYSYFKGKRDVLHSLIEWEASRVLEAGLASAGGKDGVVERLEAMFEAVDEFLRKDTFLRGIVSRDPDILTPEVISIALGFEQRVMDAVAGILEEGIESGTFRETDPKLAAYALVRLHDAFTFTAFFDLAGYRPRQISEFFLDFVKSAMMPPRDKEV